MVNKNKSMNNFIETYLSLLNQNIILESEEKKPDNKIDKEIGKLQITSEIEIYEKSFDDLKNLKDDDNENSANKYTNEQIDNLKKISESFKKTFLSVLNKRKKLKLFLSSNNEKVIIDKLKEYDDEIKKIFEVKTNNNENQEEDQEENQGDSEQGVKTQEANPNDSGESAETSEESKTGDVDVTIKDETDKSETKN
jgi:hypothetical protein